MSFEYFGVWESEQGLAEVDWELYWMWWGGKKHVEQKGGNEDSAWPSEREIAEDWRADCSSPLINHQTNFNELTYSYWAIE